MARIKKNVVTKLSLEKAVQELAAKFNGVSVLLAAVLRFHHKDDVIVPEQLIREIEALDQIGKFPGVSCELRNGLVRIFLEKENAEPNPSESGEVVVQAPRT